MLTRALPWHSLGTDVSATTTSYDALVKAGLDWEVEKQPVFDKYGDIIDGYYRNTRKDNNSTLGIVSTRYTIVQNADAFNFTDDLIGEGVRYEKAGLFHRGRAVWLLAKMPEIKVLDEGFDPYLVFTNTHDGTGSVKVAVIPMRIICSNALNLALEKASRRWSAIHARNISSKIDDAKVALGLADQYLIAFNQEADRLSTKKFSDAEFEKVIDTIFPIDYQNDSVKRIQNVRSIKTGLMDALNAPDLANFKGTAYEKIMSVTDYFDHVDPTRNTPTFYESRWANIASGHSFVDKFYTAIAA